MSRYFQELCYPGGEPLQERMMQIEVMSTMGLLDALFISLHIQAGEIEARVLDKFLDYVYTGEVEVGCLQDVWSLLSVAR